MTKKTSVRSSLFRISIIALVAGIILACADVEISPYPDSFFAPEISHNTRDFDFFVTDHLLYGASGFKTDYRNDFRDANLNEWRTYFNNSVDTTSLSYILYKARLGEIDTLIFSIKKPGFPISAQLKSNPVLKVSNARSALDFLYYIGYAKRCEEFSTYMPNYWEDDDKIKAGDPRNDKAGMLKLAQGGIKQIGNAGSNFVKQRYAFQVVRLYFQMGQFDTCISFYNSNAVILNTTENTIRYRTMGYLAGAYCKLGQIAEANFTYSIAFDRCDPMRDAAYFSFKPQEEADFAGSLALAQNTKQKTVLWEMLGLQKDPLRALKAIYALDPKAEALDLILMRVVNLEEEHFLNQSWAIGEDASDDSLTYVNTKAINTDAVNFIKTVAKAGNTAKPYEWNLAAGYLDWALGGSDYDKYFTSLKDIANTDALVGEEVRLIHLLNKVRYSTVGDKDFETSLVPELTWLKSSGHAQGFRGDFAWLFVAKTLSQKYNAIGNKAIAVCFNNPLLSMNDTLLNTMQNFLANKNKSAFETFAATQLRYTKLNLSEMQAVSLLYQYRFNDALTIMNNDAGAGTEPISADPFIIHINDNHDSDAAIKNKTVYTMKTFVQKMIELEKQASRNGKDAAQDYFLLANGYYNMSYFGNNRVLYLTQISAMGPAGYEYGDYMSAYVNGALPVYMNCDKALAYYQKAMNASTDAEFKAQCCFMCAKCEQNYFFCHKPKDYKGDFKAGTYFAMLQSGFSKTQYYQEVIKECGYFDTYANIAKPH